MPRDYGRGVFVQGCGVEGTIDLTKKHLPDGCVAFPQFFQASDQRALLAEIRSVIAQAPLYTPRMPHTGKRFSIRMTNCGALGWVSDKDGGYRYEPLHPDTRQPWPPMPLRLLHTWGELTAFPHAPQACLVNYYTNNSRLGMHRDQDEADFTAPILSISLGNTVIFRIGGLKRSDPAMSFELASGDALVLGGMSRLRYHGVDRILPGTSDLLTEGGRINLTLRYIG